MRLTSLLLESYGPFQRQEILLDPTPGRINLLVAPNGAGKSVLRRAFGDLLFDIPERSPMSWLYGTQNMRLTAQLRQDGAGLTLVRRKGRGNTLSDGTAPVPPEALRLLLGSADRRLFEDLFGLDSRLLREGGEELCRSSGRLGQMLLAGSGGLGRVQRLLEGLCQERDAIGRAERRHVSQPIWAAAAEATDAQRALGQAALRPEAFLALEKRAAEAAETLAALRRERGEVEAARAQLAALRAVRPWLGRRDAAVAVLAEAGEVPRLEAGFEARWRRALETHTAAAAAAANAAEQAAAVAATLATAAPDTTLLDAAGPVEAVLREAVTARNAARDLPEVEASCREAEREAARLRHELGWDAAVAVPPLPAVRAARERLAALAGLRAMAETAEREALAAGALLARARAELAALPEAEEIGALAAMVREIRGMGAPARLEAAQRAVREAEAELARALARLPDRALTRAALAATQAPADAVLAAREAALGEAEAAHRDALRERDRLGHELEASRAELERLRREAALPAPGALAEARAARDELWDRVCAGGGAGAAVAFERALRAADAVADALLAHAAEAARAEALHHRIQVLVAQCDVAQAAGEGSAAALSRARAALAALAEAAGAPGDMLPAALRSFLAARGAALDRAVELDRARAEEAAAAAALTEAAWRLAVTLGVPEGGLPALLELAEARIITAREAVAARKAAEAELRRATHDSAERQAAAERARAALAAWTAAWSEVAAALARPAEEAPEASGAALALMDELRGHEAVAARDGARVRDMQATLEAFSARMAALCAQVAPGLGELPPQQAAARLEAALKAQRAEAARLQALTRARDEAEARAVAASAEARLAAEALAALRAALRVEDDEAAEAQLRRIARVAEAEAGLAEARGQILALGGGMTEAALDALAAASSAGVDEAEFTRLGERLEELARLIEAASAEARSAAEARDRAGQGEDAAAAAARREAALAALSRHSEEALVLHAAASLLRAALDAERAEAGSGTVARIGEVFRALTGGGQAGVAVEDDGADQVLMALEPDGRARKTVAELSEGTRDQLFLALRIVALEAYAQANPALPFIADDILQTFDDARATAGLRALLDLSSVVQVVVLTHHPHVQALARTLPAGAVHMLVLPELPIASAA
ncbi:Chromosome partition protein smc [Rhodovastum atsumiense]|nr:AAA family ATPase [Rhodovastum atsumiense]CAH2601151.1 Chromosome partition protein smc [Rhodovastum atsumiense]